MNASVSAVRLSLITLYRRTAVLLYVIKLFGGYAGSEEVSQALYRTCGAICSRLHGTKVNVVNKTGCNTVAWLTHTVQ